MKITEYCIRTPVAPIVLSLFILIAGAAAFLKMEVRVFPAHDSSHASININYTGASPQLIETAITTPMEQALATVPNVDSMESHSTQNESDISIKFLPNTDMIQAMSDVRQAVSGAASRLPDGIDSPRVRQGHSGQIDLSEYVLYSNTVSVNDLYYLAEMRLQPAINAVPGVGSMDVWGVGDPQMQVIVDPMRMSAKNISISQLKDAVQSSNVALPGGNVRSPQMMYPLNINSQLSSVQDFSGILLTQPPAGIVRLRDVANVKLGNKEDSVTRVYRNGQATIKINVQSEVNSNQVQGHQSLMKAIKLIENTLPKDVHLVKMYDVIQNLIHAINEVYLSIGVAILCVLIVVFLFLGSLRATLIPMLCIPIALIGAFMVMYAVQLSINLFTLLALVLAVGLVVDDSIVVLENIQRHRRFEKNMLHAAIKGSNEIVYPVIAMTCTLLAVYLPFAFMSGHFARVYQQFALTLCAAVLLSGVASLTLSPLMCSSMLPSKQNKFQLAVESVLHAMQNFYQRILGWLLRHRFWVLLIVLVFIGLGATLFAKLQREVVPQEKYGILLSFVQLPDGASQQATKKQSDKIATWLGKRYPQSQVTTAVEVNGSNTAIIILTPKKDDSPYPDFNAELPKLRQALSQMPGSQVMLSVPNLFNNSAMGHNDITFYLQSSLDYSELEKVSAQVIKSINNSGLMTDAKGSLNFNHQGYDITINRELASDVGISSEAINQILNATFGDDVLTRINLKGQIVDVVMQAPDEYRKNIDSINKINLIGENNKSIPLSQLVNVKTTANISELVHLDRLRSNMIQAGLKGKHTLSEAQDYLTANLINWLPYGVNYKYTGKLKTLHDSSNNMISTFLLAIVFIYLLLSLQFKNFIDPLAVMFTVPMCIVGALGALWLIHGSINLYTTIALVTLIGLITKHGILIVQFANQQMEKGEELMDAIQHAAAIRLRPILMTTAAMVFGALPLAFAVGKASLSRQQTGWALIGGLLCGTFFSLIVVPIAYSYLAGFKSKRHLALEDFETKDNDNSRAV